MWHVYILQSLLPKALASCACGFWAATTLFRLVRCLYFGSARVDAKSSDDLIRARLELQRGLNIYPGCYFYVYFHHGPFPHRFRGLPMSVAWWDPTSVTTPRSSLVFLMKRQGAVNVLASKPDGLRSAILDGPYGHNLMLHSFENVILAAKGIGISGVLPYALDLARRRLHDTELRNQGNKHGLPSSRHLYRDKTRKVDLFWELERNSQEKWLRNELRSLQSLDPANVRTQPAAWIEVIVNPSRNFSVFGAFIHLLSGVILPSSLMHTGDPFILQGALKFITRASIRRSALE